MFGDKIKRSGRIFVKICGITNEADALAAIEAGTDALGFNLVSQSKRYLDIRTAADWIRKLPGHVCRVAVMRDPLWEDATRISQLPFIDALQLHGKESPEFCRRLAELGVRFGKALAVRDSDSLANLPDFFTDTIVLDSAVDLDFGGSGKTFPWKFASRFIRARKDLSIILAGGLNPENVVQAVELLRPRGVDVTTGVEVSPGRKDPLRVRGFVQAIRSLRPRV
jgi:phosphoribosylanthranilate isomerase